MVRHQDVDRLAEHFATGIVDRHAGRDHRALAAEIGVDVRLIIEDADPYDVIRNLRACRSGAGAGDSGRQQAQDKWDFKPHHSLAQIPADRDTERSGLFIIVINYNSYPIGRVKV